LHANVGETSAVLAIDRDLVDMEHVRDFTPDFSELRTSPFALLDPLFQSTPGSFWTLLEEGGGVWGAPSESTAERGEDFLQWATEATVALARDMDDVHGRLEHGYRRRPGDADR
jgi:creatinine amidohydrolase